MKIAAPLPDPKAPEFPDQIVSFLREVRRFADGMVEFGHPQDPTDPSATGLAGATTTSHPGTLVNIRGTWVELDVTALDTDTRCYHNLNLLVPYTGEPNVRWLLFGVIHDGTNVAAGDEVVSCNFEEGSAVDADYIDLKFYRDGSGPRTVDGTHPLKVTLFFIPAVRRP